MALWYKKQSECDSTELLIKRVNYFEENER